MDTRTKILDWLQAEAVLRSEDSTDPATVVCGYFDPLVAAHVRRLEEIAAGGGRLTVVLATPPDPLLPERARAELVAALRAVARVVIPPAGQAERVLQWFPDAKVFREEAADLERTMALMNHVRQRQSM